MLFKQILLMVITTGLLACGNESYDNGDIIPHRESEGFISDLNLCSPDTENLSAVDTSSETGATLTGYTGEVGQPTMAQRTTVVAEDEQITEVQLRLTGSATQSADLMLDLWGIDDGSKVLVGNPERKTTPDGAASYLKTTLTLAGGDVPVGGLAWVGFVSKNPINLFANDYYWLVLRPKYAREDTGNPIFVSAISGSGLATYSQDAVSWGISSERQMTYRFLKCK